RRRTGHPREPAGGGWAVPGALPHAVLTLTGRQANFGAAVTVANAPNLGRLPRLLHVRSCRSASLTSQARARCPSAAVLDAVDPLAHPRLVVVHQFGLERLALENLSILLFLLVGRLF